MLSQRNSVFLAGGPNDVPIHSNLHLEGQLLLVLYLVSLSRQIDYCLFPVPDLDNSDRD